MFSRGTIFLTYTNTSPICGFQMLIEILEKENYIIKSVTELKEILLNEYNKYN